MNTENYQGLMLQSLNERSEIQSFRDQHSEAELDEMVHEHRGLWEGFFEAEMDKKFPRHPWKVLKEARSTWGDSESDWPDMPKRHALRVVKDEYVERWEAYKEEFEP